MKDQPDVADRIITKLQKMNDLLDTELAVLAVEKSQKEFADFISSLAAKEQQ